MLFASHIVLVDRLAPDVRSRLLTWVQLGVVAVVATVTAFVFDGGIVGFERPESCGRYCTWRSWPPPAQCSWRCIWAEFDLRSSRSHLVARAGFRSFACVAAAGETLPLIGWAGGVLVLAGVVMAELKPET